MPESPANNRRLRLALVLVLLTGSGGFPGRADEAYRDDALIKSEFETRLGALFEAGGIPTGSETLKQLALEKSGPVSLPAPTTPANGTVAPYEQARLATLILGHLYLCGKCDKYHASLAGGVLISPDGLALTNYHVLDSRQGIVFGAMTSEGAVFALDEVIASSKKNDIALIRLRGAKDLPSVSLNETVATGDELFVISHPDGFFHSLTKGYLSRKYLTPKEKIPRLQITADFAKGSSGAGIFNRAGELIGLATATNSIYYQNEGESPGHLQMVIKSGVPISSISTWFGAAPRP